MLPIGQEVPSPAARPPCKWSLPSFGSVLLVLLVLVACRDVATYYYVVYLPYGICVRTKLGYIELYPTYIELIGNLAA